MSDSATFRASMMKYTPKRLWLWMWLVAMMALTPARSHAQLDRATLLDAMARIQQETQAPGLGLAIGHNGAVVFAEGIGLAEVGNRVPFTAQTVLNPGSVSKTFGAVAVMQLVAQNKVDLDAPIQTYVPFFPEKHWPVTVRQVMTHSSGIRHYREADVRPEIIHHGYESLEEAIHFWKDDSLLFEPETRWAYTSHGSNLLQGVVEAASGMDYETYLRTHLFEPAGMTRSSLDRPSRIVKGRGSGYTFESDSTLYRAGTEDPSYKFVGGGALSTVEDLARFGMAVYSGQVLPSAAREELFRVQVSDSILYFNQYDPDAAPIRLGSVKRQALIWYHEQDEAGRWWIGHSGAALGVKTMLMIYPDYDVVLAFQANLQQISPKQQGEALADLVIKMLTQLEE